MLTCGDDTAIPLAASAEMMSLGRKFLPSFLAVSRIAWALLVPCAVSLFLLAGRPSFLRRALLRTDFRAATGLGAGFVAARFLARGFLATRVLVEGFTARLLEARFGAETFAVGLFATRFLVAALLAAAVVEAASGKSDSWAEGAFAAPS